MQLYIALPPCKHHRVQVLFRATWHDKRIRSISFFHKPSAFWLPLSKKGEYYTFLSWLFCSKLHLL